MKANKLFLLNLLVSFNCIGQSSTKELNKITSFVVRFMRVGKWYKDIDPKNFSFDKYNFFSFGINNDSLPIQVKAILNDHAEELRAFLNSHTVEEAENVYKKSWLPEYYIKYGIERATNAQSLKQIVYDNKLDLIDIPEQYLYHVPGMPKEISSKNYLVIAEKVKTPNENFFFNMKNFFFNMLGIYQKPKPLNLQQVKQLYNAVRMAMYFDIHCGNFIPTRDGKIAIIDTDNQAMLPFRYIIEQRDLHVLTLLNTMIQYTPTMNGDEESCNYLVKKLEKLKNTKN